MPSSRHGRSPTQRLRRAWQLRGAYIDTLPRRATLNTVPGGAREGAEIPLAPRGDLLNLIRVMPAKGQDLPDPAPPGSLLTSAADLKFLRQHSKLVSGTSNRKRHEQHRLASALRF